MSVVAIGAPLRGWAAPLDEVPDPVFAQRMMGEGVAIDPLEGLIVAPAAGIVASVPATAHAVTLELANGAQLLIHIGLETVALAGVGFEALVVAGQKVAAGEPLIRFDLDAVARRAKSLITPIILINEGYRIEILAIGRLVEAGEPLMRIVSAGIATGAAPRQSGAAIERRLVIPQAHGIHARPAARIVSLLKPFAADVTLAAHGRSADGRSMVALMALGLKRGDEALLSAIGADAAAAVAAVATLIETGMDEAEPAPVAPVPAAPAVAGPASILEGVCAAPGFAVGPVAFLRVAAITVPFDGAGGAAEERALAKAVTSVAASFAASEDAGLADAHRALVADPQLLADARIHIAAGRSAGHAWRAAVATAAESLRATGDPLLIERIADLEDVERQVLARLTGTAAFTADDVPEGAILVADTLLPSQFLALRATVAGIVTARGGPTSHVAILAAAAGIPMLVAAGPRALALTEGRTVILDADAGRADTDPDPAAFADAQQRLAGQKARRAAEAAGAQEECRMADGTRIEIFANLSSAAEAAGAVAAGAEGCGLLRTEFLFLDRNEAPSEDEQAETYAAVAAALGGRPLIVRTLDIGGDKPVSYLPFPQEENPALGRRGIRFALARPDLLETQLRAILRGVPAASCRIMVPMVIERDELRAVRALLDKAMAAVGRRDPVQLGVMIETPAAALLAESLAAEADFLSVGTNDLTQYALACDRGNPATAAMIDALHPAVLHLIRHAAEGARKYGRWFGICGGVASDPAAAAILIGLGAAELSAAPAAIPALKASVRGLRRETCEALARQALACASAAEVRRLVAAASDEMKGAA
ncbi:MAG: ptsP [Alphaproteobacteria bacterium]|nr:ptsP [Alphaproteobacteria bacterium]